MDNVNTCDNCGNSFADSFEYNNHTKSCIVNNNASNHNSGRNTSDANNNFNPLNIFSTKPSSHSSSSQNTRLCESVYQTKFLTDFYKRKYI